MAVTKLWSVTERLGQVIDYATNPEKTSANIKREFSPEQYQALADVIAYAKDEEKTEREFYVEGINCNVAIARDQFITVKEQYQKTDGIQAYHGYLSFKETDISVSYTHLNSRANTSAFSQDSSFSLLSALEIIGEDGELERKADMFSKRTIKPHTPVTSVDTASEALAVSLGEKATIDMDYMMELSGKSENEIFEDLKGVIFLNPLYEYGNAYEPKYLMADEYLSGNVREKLRIAKNSAELYPEDYKVNVEALQKVQPKDLTASEISVRLGATWLPPDDVQEFIFHLLETPRYAQWNIKVHFSPFTSEWNMEGKSYDKGNVRAYNTYGTSRINAYKTVSYTHLVPFS